MQHGLTDPVPIGLGWINESCRLVKHLIFAHANVSIHFVLILLNDVFICGEMYSPPVTDRTKNNQCSCDVYTSSN